MARLSLRSLQAPGGVLSAGSDLAKTLVNLPGQRANAENERLRLQLGEEKNRQQQDFQQRREERIVKTQDRQFSLQERGQDFRESQADVARKQREAARKVKNDAATGREILSLRDKQEDIRNKDGQLAARLAEATAGIETATSKARQRNQKDIEKRFNRETGPLQLERLRADGNPDKLREIDAKIKAVRDRLDLEGEDALEESPDVLKARATLLGLKEQKGIFEDDFLRLGDRADNLSALLSGGRPGTERVRSGDAPKIPRRPTETETALATIQANGALPEDPSVEQIIQTLGGKTPGQIAIEEDAAAARKLQEDNLFLSLQSDPAERKRLTRATLFDDTPNAQGEVGDRFDTFVASQVPLLRDNINRRLDRRSLSVPDRLKLEQSIGEPIRKFATTALKAQVAGLGFSADKTARVAQNVGDSLTLGDIEVFTEMRKRRKQLDDQRMQRERALSPDQQMAGSTAVDPKDLAEEVYTAWLSNMITKYHTPEE